ncbi:MAG: CTP synthase, partial [bacterium]|nr:CTP synthase [bacterium]
TASIGRILQSRGFTVTAIKIDPYVNVDAGTMNPIEHGEVFVTHDGDECDQDIGNYERFLDTDIPRENYMTTGRVYDAVIRKERNLEYGGRCVQVVPDIPDEVIRRIRAAQKKAKADFVITEVGGTVGEYENILFLEAVRMLKLEEPKNVQVILVSYLPVPSHIGEMKTKPTQHASRSLNAVGLQADFILARATHALDAPRKRKLAVFCNMREEDIISAPDVESIYEIPINFEHDELGNKILKKFGARSKKKDLEELRVWVAQSKAATRPVRIGIVGKYFGTGDYVLTDSYISVIESIKYASWAWGRRPELAWLNSEEFEENPARLKTLGDYDGVIVPGGFGARGVEGKIKAIEFVRTHKIPYFGLCYGMQLATIEFARNVCGLAGAHTTEVDPNTPHPVIDTMSLQVEHIKQKRYGGTMRLGVYPCALRPGTISAAAYGKKLIDERHRHRYELNNKYRPEFEAKGMIMAGTSPDDELVEIIELKDHPFFVGTQFHPEFLSRIAKPHPLFKAFIKAAACL